MGKKQRVNKHATIESNIIEFLMLSEADNITAKDIAVGIGLHSASDVTGRLNALHGKGIITKSRINKRVYWGVVQNNRPDSATVAGNENVNSSSPQNFPPHSIYEQPESDVSNESEPNIVDGLLLTIDNLQSEIKFLREICHSFLSGNCHVNSKGELYSNCDATSPIASPAESASDDDSSFDGNLTTFALFAHETPRIPEEGFATPKRSAPPPPTRSWAPEPIATANEIPSRIGDGDDGGEIEAATTPLATRSPERIAALNESLSCIGDGGDGDSGGSDAATTPRTSTGSKVGGSQSGNAAPLAPPNQDANVTRCPKRPPIIVDKEPCEWRHPLAGVTTEDLDETLTPVSEEVKRIVAGREGIARQEKAAMARGEWKQDARQPLVAVVGDSMIKRMSQYDIKKRTTTASTFVRPFNGARIEDMMDYLQPVLRRGPDVVVLHIGTNDLNEGRFTSEEDVIDRLNVIVEYLQACGVIVIISFVICRLDEFINFRVQKFNKLLFDYCARNLIIFIQNDNIDIRKLNRDGIHLNTEGANILCDNISKCIDYVIPYCFGR